MKKEIILASVLVSLLLIGTLSYSAFLSGKEKSDNSIIAGGTYTTPRQTNINETGDTVEEITYSIVINDRNRPCSNIKQQSPKSKFVVLFSKYYITDNQLIERYRFGEISSQEKDTILNETKKSIDKQLARLNIQEWNQEVLETKNEFNSTIVNGELEDCFDDYLINYTTVDEYLASDAVLKVN